MIANLMLALGLGAICSNKGREGKGWRGIHLLFHLYPDTHAWCMSMSIVQVSEGGCNWYSTYPDTKSMPTPIECQRKDQHFIFNSCLHSNWLLRIKRAIRTKVCFCVVVNKPENRFTYLQVNQSIGE